MVPILVNIAFFTLLERKVLRFRQTRKGPNKVSVGGICQPFADAIKLFLKENTRPLIGVKKIFFLAPGVAIIITLLSWWLGGFRYCGFNWDFSVGLLICFMSLNSYPLFMSGWSSTNKYASIGAMRGIAQSISYEIRLGVVILGFLSLSHSLSLYLIVYPLFKSYSFVILPGVFYWLVCCVAETNRSPFDFAEGESELVSGFNVEYGATAFAFIFMAEYGRIMFLSFLTGRILSKRGGLYQILLTVLLVFFWV